MTSTPGWCSPSIGGCDFPVDPDQPADIAPTIWLPKLLPDAIKLQPVVSGAGDLAAMPLDLANLVGIDGRIAADGTWNGLWRLTDVAHQIWMNDAPATGMTNYFVMLPLDALLELRTEAMLRFWRSLVGRPSGQRSHNLPPQSRSRHILTLRALDGHSDGASYRQIAEALFDFRGTKTDWESDPRKNRTRRLIADGQCYMHGGYRNLLYYPIRLPRRR